MVNVRLGRIKSAEFGLGGYQDAMLGVTFDLGGDGWGVMDHRGAWAVECSEHAKWTEEDRLRELGQMCMFVNALLAAAKKQKFKDIVGVPVEITFEGNLLRSWRILTEVL